MVFLIRTLGILVKRLCPGCDAIANQKFRRSSYNYVTENALFLAKGTRDWSVADRMLANSEEDVVRSSCESEILMWYHSMPPSWSRTV